jgi:glycosyltransferase domain-containing protein
MIEAGKVAILVHTANRPWFLLRLLDYYQSVPDVRGIEVVVLDASRDEAAATFERERRRRRYDFPLRVLRRDPSWSIYRRLGFALDSIASPYLILAADDDLYFFDWIPGAIELLDSDPTFGTVYGHTLRFEMDEFVPYGTRVEYFIDPDTNPPNRWLEGETAAERLAELGNPETYPATAGWYALQRTSELRIIVDLAIKHELSDAFFEKFLIFAQAALHKTRRIDRVFLARQCARGEVRAPASFRDSAGQIARLRAACLELLAGLGFEGRAAEDLFELAHRGDFAEMKRADAKRHLRRIADAVPLLRRIWEWLMPKTGAAFELDERLPKPPSIDECQREVAIVRRIVSPGAEASPEAALLNRKRSRRA